MIINIELGKFAKDFNKYANIAHKTYISYNQCTYALQSIESPLNIEYCNMADIKILQTNHLGGTIVLSPGSIGFARLDYDIENKFSTAFRNAIIDFLCSKGLSATYDGNDILINGIYKPIGISKVVLPNGIVYYAAIFSATADRELINKICTKPANKIPAGLVDFGISMSELRNFIIDFVDKYDNEVI